MYDYMLTITREIELFWKRPKRSWWFILFVANRYISVLGHVSTVLVYWFLSQSDHTVGCLCSISHEAEIFNMLSSETSGELIGIYYLLIFD